MEPGSILAQRFEIERETGSGGTSSVYCAKDRLTGDPVALKVMRGGLETERFAREARAIAELAHPGIVRYVAHGSTPGGQHYLAMEWLSGEDLNQRLVRTGLSVGESVRVVARAAEALGYAHARGVIHRDVKPSNLFLPDGDLERVKVIDFGLARLAGFATSLTAVGNVIGTPGYFAPEQAQGQKHIDARADVFSLGCVLFKCLTGRRAFEGEDMIAVVAKVVLEAAPRVSELRPEIPAALDGLIAQMLAKHPDARPADARAVAEALAALEGLDEERRVPAPVGPPRLTGTEQRLVSVVVAARAVSAFAGPDATYPDRVPESEQTIDEARAPGVASTEQRLRAAVEAHGARVAVLFDGSAVATLTGAGSASDLAVRAARSALAMRAVVPHAAIGLATGRGLVTDRPVGEVIDRATRLARGLRREQVEQSPSARRSGADAARPGPDSGSRPAAVEGSAPEPPIRLDEVTAALLEGRFRIGGDASARELLGEGEPVDAGRTLLGKATPFVGRERELGALLATFDECVGEPVARAVLVTGAAGVGKSRLRHEIIGRLLRRGEGEGTRLEIWESRGDPMRAGSPFGMIAPAIRRAAGVLEGEPAPVRQQRLRDRLAQSVPPADLDRVAEFIGELVGVPFPDESSIQLRAARQDPVLMGDQLRRAFEDLLAAECARGPMLLVLDDLHWGDLPSVRLVDAALRNLKDRPLMVLALGRPEVHEQFPMLWTERGLQEQPLGELLPKACERLVRAVLGHDVAHEVVERVVAQAMGNAFYLEELIRAVADATPGAEPKPSRSLDRAPETVLAMVHARLERIGADARRVLRAASVFGGVFWLGGVRALLGGPREAELGHWIADLVEREMVSPRASSRLSGETEYAFRHALVREAAYATLTEGDRALGHRLAAAWLEAIGETDPSVLAEHFERGAEPGRAVVWYLRAADQALDGNDLEVALERAGKGLAGGAGGEDRGARLLAQAEAQRWRGRPAEAEAAGLEAMRWLPRASARWFGAAGQVANARGILGRAADLEALTRELLALEPESGAAGAQLVAVAHAAGRLLFTGRYDIAEPLLEWLCDRAADVPDDATAQAWVERALAIRAAVSGDPGGRLERWAAAAECFERVGDLRNACMQRVNLGESFAYVGAYREAERTLREALLASERMGALTLIATAKQQLGGVLAVCGMIEEARALERESVEILRTLASPRMEGMSRVRLAQIHLLAGDVDEAAHEASVAADLLSIAPPARPHALATLARARTLQGDIPAALTAAREAIGLLGALGHVDEGESLVRLVYAEICRLAGDLPGASQAVASARRSVLERADKIADPALRRSFLEQVADNAATLTLAEEWSDSDGPPSSAGHRRSA